MFRRAASVFVVVFLAVGFVLIQFCAPQSAYAESVITVDDDRKDYPAADYTSIGEAVKKATAGATIVVYPGMYVEALEIAKPLRIKGVDYPIITLLGATIVTVKASGVILEGLYVTGGRFGVYAAGIKNLTIAKCMILDNAMRVERGEVASIYIHNSSAVKIVGSQIRASGTFAYYPILSTVEISGGGILISSSSAVEISENQIDGNIAYGGYYTQGDYGGIYIRGSTLVKITNNQISNNGLYGDYYYGAYGGGIYVTGSSAVEIIGNQISSNTLHVRYTAKGGGIYVTDSSGVKIRGNVFSNNTCGVYLRTSAGLEISFNEFKNNKQDYVNEGNIAGAILYTTSKINYLYQGRNFTSYLGNYWDKYEGEDKDGNGIGDTPYDKDAYPLIKPIENYKTTVTVYTTPLRDEKTTVTTTETVTKTITQPITTTLTVTLQPVTTTLTKTETQTTTVTAATATITVTATQPTTVTETITQTATLTSPTTLTRTVTQPTTITETKTTTSATTLPPTTSTVTKTETKEVSRWSEPPVALIAALGMFFASLAAAILIARRRP
jgi:parallel beta-helix repeat protein